MPSIATRFTFVFTMSFAWLVAAVPLPAGLKWAETARDLVANPAKSEIATTFSFINEGRTTIKVVDVVTSCGCTVANLDKKIYESGEAGRVEVVVHYTVEASALEQSVVIVTEEQGTTRTTLVVKVTVPGKHRPLERIEMSPGTVDWTQGSKPVPQVITLRIPRIDDAIRPISVTVDNEQFVAALRQPDPGNQHLYELVVTPRRTDRPAQSAITILTNSRTFRPSWLPDITYKITAAVK